MEGYLVEIRSVGGLSGSPVFVVLDPLRRKSAPGDLGARAYVLGLIHRHWDRRIREDEYVDASEERVNQGVAVVVPAAKILEVLNDPLETRKRAESWARRQKGR